MDIDDSCCPLPFYLQDLCLLVVINELDCYPTELLASLPYWLRYRILNNVPALDLSRLEATPVASGVDTDGIWKSRFIIASERSRYTRVQSIFQGPQLEDDDKETPTKGDLFHLNVSDNRRIYSALPFGGSFIPGGSDLTKHIIKDLEKAMRESEVSIGNRHMLEIVSDLLTHSYKTNLENDIRRLVSIQGNLVLSNLLTGLMHQDCLNPIKCSEKVWKRQVTALVVKDNPYRGYYFDSHRDIELTPHRHISLYDKCDLFELLSILGSSCQLCPRGVNICISEISQSFLPRLYAERLALDGNLTLPTIDSNCIPIFQSFVENVVSLRLQCDNYGQIGVVVSMIKAAVANGQASSLKHLICAIPDLYTDIIELLCALFSLQNFHLLVLDVSEVYPLTLSKLLRAFIAAPCPHLHKLIIHVKQDPHFQLTLTENQVASLDMKGANICSCSLQHKVIEFSSSDRSDAMYVLLQFPTIRLKKLRLFTSSKNFHFCAIHPDLQTTKLHISVGGENSQCKTTLQQDTVTLFGIPSLRKICIHGIWGRVTEIKDGLVFGLQGRSGLPPLVKLSLELEWGHSYEFQDFEMLCDAIFSLPQLENLKLVLGRGFSDMISQNCYEEVLYKCWSRKAAGVKLKSIFLQTFETDLKQVSLVTQTLSFSLPRRIERVSPDYDLYYDDYDYNYVSSDDGYSYDYYDDPWTYNSDDS